MAGDIAPKAIFGKPEMADLRGFKADRDGTPPCRSSGFNGLLTQLRERLRCALGWNLALSSSPHNDTVKLNQNRGSTIMKSFIVLAAVAVLTVGNAIAAMPGAAGSVRTISAAQPVVSMAEQELPFDRYWSKN